MNLGFGFVDCLIEIGLCTSVFDGKVEIFEAGFEYLHVIWRVLQGS